MADIRIVDLPTNNITLSSDYFIFESLFQEPETYVTSKNTLSTFKDKLETYFTTNEKLSTVLLSGGYINQSTALAYSIAL